LDDNRSTDPVDTITVYKWKLEEQMIAG